METIFFKLLGPVKTFGKWLYTFATDQTKIKIVGASSPTLSSDSLLINVDQNGVGSLLFGISTKSDQPVDLMKLAIDYSSPLQLFDPKKMGFFSISRSGDDTLPFRVCWEGNIELREMVINAFALSTHFPLGTDQLPIRISTQARVVKSTIGGFVEHGRAQATTQMLRIVRTNVPVGLQVAPQHSLTSSQPYLIQSAQYVTTDAESIAPLLVHQQFDDGTVSSELFHIQGTRPGGID
jgi:hypothetical protein